MDVMEKYQKVQVAVPPSLNAKGIDSIGKKFNFQLFLDGICMR